MAGQIVKRGERTWLVRVSRGRDASGKWRYLNKTIHGTKKDAQNYLNKKLTEISSGTLIIPTRLTLDEFLDKWLDVSARPRLRERTFEHYRGITRSLYPQAAWRSLVSKRSRFRHSETVRSNAE
jgi:integrase